jgi:hypothetical protein
MIATLVKTPNVMGLGHLKKYNLKWGIPGRPRIVRQRLGNLGRPILQLQCG